jgi:hypothetical protein
VTVQEFFLSLPLHAESYKAIQIPAVTTQSDMDLQKYAELQASRSLRTPNITITMLKHTQVKLQNSSEQNKYVFVNTFYKQFIVLLKITCFFFKCVQYRIFASLKTLPCNIWNDNVGLNSSLLKQI